MKLLVVEDERRLNALIIKVLEKEGFVAEGAYDGEEALELALLYEYDLILLDIMMPKLDGHGFIKALRNNQCHAPVLMLTAKDSLEDKVKGLDLGADDYLIKPFEFEELLARIRAILRRNSKVISSNVFYLRERIYVDFAKKVVFKDEVALDLTSKEYEILEYLARNHNQILSKAQIKDHVWPYDNESESNVIEVMIKNLRKKLEDQKEDAIIKTKRGLGYYVSIQE